MNARTLIISPALLILLAGSPVMAQGMVAPVPATPAPTVETPAGPMFIVPQVHRRTMPARYRHVELSNMNARVSIDGQVATTTLEMVLKNTAGFAQQAEMVIPVPDGVTIRSVEYSGAGAEPNAKLLPRAEARKIYDSIVASMRDPALIEFAGYNLIRTSVFPIPAGGQQTVKVTYEQLLTLDNGRMDYWLPRGESLASTGTAWNISATIKSDANVASIFSPSHEINVERQNAREMTAKVVGTPGAGPFRLSLIREQTAGALSSSFYAYPDPTLPGGQGGYFMLVVAPPATPVEDVKKPKREVTLVIDRSGSMRGEKIEQARQAAEQVVEGLRMGEAFNIVDFSDTINSFSPTPSIKTAETLAKARAYIRGIQANGGTNIHDALLEALRKAPTAETLPLVLFMTDGLPTVGITGEVPIREAAKAANSANRRIFSFGVGLDVNTPLLSNLSSASRGAPTFILPSENVEQKLSQVFRRLDGPVLSSPMIAYAGPGIEPGARVIAEVMPRELPDVFEGDQLVVMGQYSGASPIKLKLSGSYLGQAKDIELTLDPSSATVRHAFVPRLWASRKIASLVDSIRQAGAVSDPTQDPKTKELVEEIVTLSTKFGILTEYTSFLATEPGVVTSERPQWMLRAGGAELELAKRMAEDSRVRAGGGAVGKDATVHYQTMNSAASNSNVQLCLDANGAMFRKQLEGVQQLADQSLFCRNNRWIDARLLKTENDKPDRTVEFGTPEFESLLTELIAENRQGMLAQAGEVLILVNNQRVLVKMPAGIE